MSSLQRDRDYTSKLHTEVNMVGTKQYQLFVIDDDGEMYFPSSFFDEYIVSPGHCSDHAINMCDGLVKRAPSIARLLVEDACIQR